MCEASYSWEADGMDKELWNVFLDTGDPVGYLLCRAGEEKKKQEKKKAAKPKEPPRGGASL